MTARSAVCRARRLLDLLAAPAIPDRCRACGEEASQLRRGPWITY